MVAESVDINCFSSGDKLDGGLVELDTVSAETGWWMFESKEPEAKVLSNAPWVPSQVRQLLTLLDPKGSSSENALLMVEE